MDNEANNQPPTTTTVTVADVNRVLEVGRLLISVLTPEELEELQQLLNGDISEKGITGVT